AKYADEANARGDTPEATRPFFEACSAACEAVGRDPATLRRSAFVAGIFALDDADADRQVAAHGLTREQLWDRRVMHPVELLDLLHAFEDAGYDRVVLSRPGAVDIPSLRMLGHEVIAKFR